MNEFEKTLQTTLSAIEAARLEQLRGSLDAAMVQYTIFAHDLIVQSAREGVEQGFGDLANMAPTLILRSEAGFLAAIIRGDTRLSYRKIRRELKLKDLCLASPGEVKQVTGAEIGYVSLLNAGIPTIVDSRLVEVDTIFGGCGVPRYTLQIHPRDLIVLAQARVFDFAEPKSKE